MNTTIAKTAIMPRRDQDFPEWYQQVIRAAELAEPSDVRGCMPVGTRLVTGLAFFDQPVGGGLPKGAITELISPRRSAGSASLVHAFIRGAYRDKYFVALIDGRDSFDP